jgi:hypothetical protein
MAGMLTVVGDLTLGANSLVKLDLFTNGSDSLRVTDGSLTLAGELDITLADSSWTSFSPVALISHIGSGEITGGFDVIHGLDHLTTANTGWLFDPNFSASGLTITKMNATVVGSNSSYMTTSNSADDYVIGTGGNVTAHLGGGTHGDVFIGHGGYNTVGITSMGFHYIDGGASGGNQLLWEADTQIDNPLFDLTKLASPSMLSHFDVLNMQAAGNSNNSAILDLAHLQAMTQSTNAVTGTDHTLVVIGSNATQLSFADSGWHADGQATLTVNDHQGSYTQYSNGSTHVMVESQVNVHLT